MKVTIPNELKADMPQTTWGKIFSATPVVMAVLATMLAGLASSEMTRAQYDRSLAAQQQSKAGDQWSFFQAKRLRGAVQRNTVDLLQSATGIRSLEPGAIAEAAQHLSADLESLGARARQSPQATLSSAPGDGLTPPGQAFEKFTQNLPQRQSQAALVTKELANLLQTPQAQQALSLLSNGQIPALPAEPATDPRIKAALEVFESQDADKETAAALVNVSPKELEQAVRAAREHAQAFDTLTKPINQTIDQIESLLTRASACFQDWPGTTPWVGVALARDFTAARLRYAAMRYETEGRLNQSIANLYELQVRKSNISAERHHVRSQRFFFGMLGAQTGVIISTFAMAARKRNLLWSLAAAAGLIAIAFAIYVYLYV